jgi:hypothetical protein
VIAPSSLLTAFATLVAVLALIWLAGRAMRLNSTSCVVHVGKWPPFNRFTRATGVNLIQSLSVAQPNTAEAVRMKPFAAPSPLAVAMALRISSSCRRSTRLASTCCMPIKGFM